MNNGPNIDRTADRDHGDHRATDPTEGQPRQAGALGKRPSSTAPVMDTKREARHSRIVTDTVTTLMDSYFLEENNLLMDDNQSLVESLDEMRKTAARLQRRLELSEIQLNASRRYAAMITTWCPQVREMFDRDFEAMLEIQAEQTVTLEENLELLFAETEGEDEEIDI